MDIHRTINRNPLWKHFWWMNHDWFFIIDNILGHIVVSAIYRDNYEIIIGYSIFFPYRTIFDNIEISPSTNGVDSMWERVCGYQCWVQVQRIRDQDQDQDQTVQDQYRDQDPQLKIEIRSPRSRSDMSEDQDQDHEDHAWFSVQLWVCIHFSNVAV